MNWINSDLGVAATIAFWAHGIFVILNCVGTAVLYWKAKDQRLKNIVGVAIAHMILTVVVLDSLLGVLYPVLSIKGAFVMIAFALTDYHLISLLVDRYPKVMRQIKG